MVFGSSIKRFQKNMLKNNTKLLNQDIINLCKNFAENCYWTNAPEYEKRNQNNPEKIKQDIAYGKMAEFGVYFILLEKGMKHITIPDTNIYNHKSKSFEADLKCESFNFHIKTQTLKSASKFGESWTFQKKDPLVINPKSYEYFIGTQLNEDNFEVKILLSKLATGLKFEDPVLEKLKTKTCVYLKNNL
jgi:hypothetical protein